MLKASETQFRAEVLASRADRHIRRNARLLQKANNPRDIRSIGGTLDRIHVLIARKPKERKPNATVCIAGPRGLRATIELLPGGSGTHNPRYARDLNAALERVREAPSLRIPGLFYEECPTFRHIVSLIRYVSEAGDIHDFTEDKDNVNCQIAWLAYNGNIDRDKYIPFPDLALSNFETRDIYYRTFANFLDVEPFQKIRESIQFVYRRRVFIEQPSDMPGIVRIYPVGDVDHLTNNPTLLTSGEGLTKLRLGFKVQGEIGEPYDYDLRSLFNNTHWMVLGASGVGKTNDIGNKLYRLKLMANVAKENRIVGRVIFVDSEKRAAGLDMYKDDGENPGVEFVTDPVAIREKFVWLHGHYLARVRKLTELKLTNWPVGQTIDGERYTGTVLMMDEATACLNENWTINIPDPDNPDAKGIKVQKLFVHWSRVFRACGILMILYVHKARAIEGVPTGLTDNCLLKQCFRLEDSSLAPDFFNCEAKRLALPPTEFENGMCLIKTPSMQYTYAKTEKSPHEIEQEKLRAQRGY
jgi:hypothetical protein